MLLLVSSLRPTDGPLGPQVTMQRSRLWLSVQVQSHECMYPHVMRIHERAQIWSLPDTGCSEGVEAGDLCRNMFNATLTIFGSRGKVVVLEKLRIPSPGPKKC